MATYIYEASYCQAVEEETPLYSVSLHFTNHDSALQNAMKLATEYGANAVIDEVDNMKYVPTGDGAFTGLKFDAANCEDFDGWENTYVVSQGKLFN